MQAKNKEAEHGGDETEPSKAKLRFWEEETRITNRRAADQQKKAYANTAPRDRERVF